jgi:ATP-dependent helicase HepA
MRLTDLETAVFELLRRSSRPRTVPEISAELKHLAFAGRQDTVRRTLEAGLRDFAVAGEDGSWWVREADRLRPLESGGWRWRDEVEVAEPSGSTYPDERDIVKAAAQVREGTGVGPMTVRQLLTAFGHRRRGKKVVADVRMKLRNEGVATRPDFATAPLDSAIQLVPEQREAERTQEIRATAGPEIVELPPDQHRFCYSQQFGAGKGIGLSDTHVRVRFFRQVGAEPFVEMDLPQVSLEPHALYRQTRVYWRDRDRAVWQVGRVLEQTGSAYEVRLDTLRETRTLPICDLEVRWRQPIEDPTAYLGAHLTEWPASHRARADFVRSLTSQRASVNGIGAVLSSSIELERHQLEVVRRVLQDPVQRYLLADEVGLGKTIEAGLIARQYLIDHRRGEVVVIVPNHLVEQWEGELVRRFHLGALLGSRVRVLGFGELKGLNAGPRGLVIVDEAHRLASLAHSTDSARRKLFGRLAAITREAERLLLLSATPVLRNEAGYLAMLHLIDPNQYALDEDGTERLRARLEHRQEVANICHGLDPDLDDYFLESHLERLRELFPEDGLLGKLCESCAAHVERFAATTDPARGDSIRALRTHLSDTYRLDRRLLRNRRANPEIEVLIPGRDGCTRLEYEDPLQSDLESWLDDWRSEASFAAVEDPAIDGGLADVFWQLLVATLDSPSVLRKAVQERLKSNESGLPALLFEGESGILEEGLAILRDRSKSMRLQALERHLAESPKSGTKFVVFASSAAVADEASRVLRSQFGTMVVRHGSSEQDWQEFLNTSSVRVVICDSQAEEGLNLQTRRAQLVHFDTPLNAGRVEQRLGRLDRYGTSESVESTVLLPMNSEYSRAVLDYLDRGVGVFDRSVASLQFALAESKARIRQELLHQGAAALGDETDTLAGKHGLLARELGRIQAQDDLDAIEWESDDDAAISDAVHDIDLDTAVIANTCKYWIENTLRIDRVHWNAERKSFRLQLTSKSRVPVGDFVDGFLGAIDSDSDGFQAAKPWTHELTVHRTSAVRHGLRILRIGNPIVDALGEYARWDDRGSCFAFWRQLTGAVLDDDPSLVFRVDFLVEADVGPAAQLAEISFDGSHNSQHAARRLADGLLPPIYETVWLGINGKPIPEDLADLAQRPFAHHESHHHDTPIVGEAWDKYVRPSDSGWWREQCATIGEAARSLIHGSVQVRSHLERGRVAAARYRDATKFLAESRLRTLPHSLAASERQRVATEQKRLSAVLKGIEHPAIAMDSAGVVFLSNGSAP